MPPLLHSGGGGGLRPKTAQSAAAAAPADRFWAVKLHKDAVIPTEGTPGSAGYDLYALTDVTLKKGHITKVPLGLKLGYPDGCYGQLKVRSGHALNRQMVVDAGVLDPDYEGEVILLCSTRSDDEQTIPKGKALAQLVLGAILQRGLHHLSERHL